jgi:nuclear pore complex protein Nup93
MCLLAVLLSVHFLHAGTLLGGGGALGSSGAIQQFVPDPKQRQNLFESVAYDCQINQQPDEARELFMAAQKPRAALKIINQQLSAAIHANKGVGGRKCLLHSLQ